MESEQPEHLRNSSNSIVASNGSVTSNDSVTSKSSLTSIAQGKKQRTVPILILAAGESKRFSGCKQLATDNQGIGLLERSVKTAISANIGPVFVVLGARSNDIQETLVTKNGYENVRFIHNPHWKAGMGTSISFGTSQILKEHECAYGILIMLADQVALSFSDLEYMVQRAVNNPDKSIASAFDGTVGPPCYFPTKMFQHLKELNPEQGAKHLLLDQDVLHIENPNAAIDIDYKSQWEKWIKPTQANDSSQ